MLKVALLLFTNFGGIGLNRDSLPYEIIRNDFKKFYDEYNVDGSFALYSAKKKNYIFYNKSFYNKPCTPASTFNVLFTLIGLHEGIIKNENTVLPTIITGNDSTHKDLNLLTAFKRNMELYFIRLRSKISDEKMKNWLDEADYGNKDVSGGPLDFWLGTSLKITPAQQLVFIQKFYYEQLLFSKKEYNLVKKLMIEKNESGYKVYGKRGSYKVVSDNKYIGWFVGYAITKDDVYFFVNYIESPDMSHPGLVDAQKDIVFKILKSLQF